MQLLLECAALIVLAGLCLRRPRSAPSTPPAARLPRLPAASRRHPWMPVLLAGALAFGASALLAGFTGLPRPAVHDEFSHLLAADTFAHGRLANPTHPFWKHFETFHVIQTPVYASKYPPAQGLMLAAGRWLCGLPIAGVWLSVALAAAATCWMLAGWLPRRWLGLGGLLVVIRLVFSGPVLFNDPAGFAYWSQSYWGGAVAALGGALVWGALPRILRHRRGRDAAWLALGLTILGFSRPFEGLLVSLPALAALGAWAFRNRRTHPPRRMCAIALPGLTVLAAAAAAMMYLNLRQTGHPLHLAYQVHESQYGAAPVFLWQRASAPPAYRHPVMRDFHVGWSRLTYEKQQSPAGALRGALSKIRSLWLFYVGLLLTPVLAALPWTWHRPRVKWALAGCGLVLAGLLSETWTFPHYAAPAAAPVLLLLMEGLRQIRLIRWRRRPVGRLAVARLAPVLAVAALLTFAASRARTESRWPMERFRMADMLKQIPGRHLVIVSYGRGHSPHEEWVYNEADIDASAIVWARRMSPAENARLIDGFRGRQVWWLHVEPGRPLLRPGLPQAPSPSDPAD